MMQPDNERITQTRPLCAASGRRSSGCRIKCFTLLEVLAAMLILTLSAGLLAWQLSAAATRSAVALERLELAGELIQAAEHLLLYGPGRQLEEENFSGAFDIKFEFAEPESADAEHRGPIADPLLLRKLTIEAVSKESGISDALTIDAWERQGGG